MEQPHRSPIIEHFVAPKDDAHLLIEEEAIDLPVTDDDNPDAAEEDTPLLEEEAGTDLLLSAPADDEEEEEEDAPPTEDEVLPSEEVFSLDDVSLEDTAAHTGPAVLDVEGTASIEEDEEEDDDTAEEPIAPVEPAALTVREEQGRVWIEVPSDASVEAVIAGFGEVELSGGVLWLALDGRATTAAEVQQLASAASEALGRPVAGVKVFRGGLADGLRQETGLAVEIDGDGSDKSAGSESRGRQVLVVERTLRSGTSTRFRGDILIYGDVNAGAEVEAAGNIVVLGALRGLAWAGSGGDDSAMIISFDLRPTQVRIGRRIAFLPERPRGRAPRLPEVALVQDDEIVLREYRGRMG